MDLLYTKVKDSTRNDEGCNNVFVIANAMTYKLMEQWAFSCGFNDDNILTVNGNAFDVVLRTKAFHGGPVHIISSDFRVHDIDLMKLFNGEECVALIRPCGTSLCALSITNNAIEKFSELVDLYHSIDENVVNLSYTKLIDDMKNSIGIKSKRIDSSEPEWMNSKLCDSYVVEWMNSHLSLKDYKAKWFLTYKSRSNIYSNVVLPPKQTVHAKSFARIGFMGNPSDGFFGKTISATISNFWVEMSLIPNMNIMDASISFANTPVADLTSFSSINSCSKSCRKNGYYGSNRLFLSTLNLFSQLCLELKINTSHGFTLFYRTTIPRQVGLAGSSALVTSLIKALVIFYNVPKSKLSLAFQANMALYAEREELGISAGYQDRVIQMYGGCVSMSFDRVLMETRGYGDYERLDAKLLPERMWMGRVHNTIKERFSKGDREVVDAMAEFGSYALLARNALVKGDKITAVRLMNQNFSLRQRLYGNELIGVQTLQIVDIAHRHGHAAKLSGSGGCVIGAWGQKDETERAASIRNLRKELEKNGFVFCQLKFND